MNFLNVDIFMLLVMVRERNKEREWEKMKRVKFDLDLVYIILVGIYDDVFLLKCELGFIYMELVNSYYMNYGVDFCWVLVGV